MNIPEGASRRLRSSSVGLGLIRRRTQRDRQGWVNTLRVDPVVGKEEAFSTTAVGVRVNPIYNIYVYIYIYI